ncbi:Rhs element Vgr protein [Salinisphaera sp. C84B14]
MATNGPLSLQDHDDTLEILADDSVTVASSSDTVNVFAQTKIAPTSGQSTVTLEGGNITFSCPGTSTVKGGAHGFVGLAQDTSQPTPLSTGQVEPRIEPFNNDRFDEAIRLVRSDGYATSGVDYTLHLSNGEVVNGTTDAYSKTKRVRTSRAEKLIKPELCGTDKVGRPQHQAQAGDQRRRVELILNNVETNQQNIGSSIKEVKTPEGKSRPLANGEIALARKIFGDSIDYSKIRVHNDEYLWLGLQSDDTAMTPNRELYFNPKNFLEDYSTDTPGNKWWFMHEMTHIWQYQLSYPVKWRGALRLGLSYEYSLSENKRLSNYNMEAQGNILADYFALKVLTRPDVVAQAQYRNN